MKLCVCVCVCVWWGGEGEAGWNVQKWGNCFWNGGGSLNSSTNYGVDGVCVMNTHEAISFFFFLNWDSLHARLKSHYKAWSFIQEKEAQKD